MDLNLRLFDNSCRASLRNSLGRPLNLDRLLEFFAHFLAGNTNERSLKFEALRRSERNVDLLLGFGVDNAFVVVKSEALVEDLLNFGYLLLTHALFARLRHS